MEKIKASCKRTLWKKAKFPTDNCCNDWYFEINFGMHHAHSLIESRAIRSAQHVNVYHLEMLSDDSYILLSRKSIRVWNSLVYFLWTLKCVVDFKMKLYYIMSIHFLFAIKQKNYWIMHISLKYETINKIAYFKNTKNGNKIKCQLSKRLCVWYSIKPKASNA